MRCQAHACPEQVPAALSAEGICVEHFLEQVQVRAGAALGRCAADQPVTAAEVEWLFSQVNFALLRLTRSPDEVTGTQREQILELLLCIANLNEYMRHHSVRLAER
ncbi:MAG: hypothetical protein ACRD5F_11820 [Candidatus Acidiferrales bacterium]